MLSVLDNRTDSSEDDKVWYTYIVKCSDGSLYTGITNDLTRRILQHNLGKGAKYTKHRRPVELVYNEQHPNRSEASKREYAIKQLTKKEKEKLCVG